MPHISRSTTTDAIEPDLAALWREVARQGPVARAVMSNLIVFRECSDDRSPADDLSTAPALEEVVARHPCRLIVLDHQHNPSNVRTPFAVRRTEALLLPFVEQPATRSANRHTTASTGWARRLTGNA